MDPNPPRPEYQIAIMFLIAVELVATIFENDMLFVASLLLIVAVAIQWYRYSNRGKRKPKYAPEKAVPQEDWGGKLDGDGRPL